MPPKLSLLLGLACLSVGGFGGNSVEAWQDAPKPLPSAQPLKDALRAAKETLEDAKKVREDVATQMAQIRERYDNMVKFKEIPEGCVRHVNDVVARYEDIATPAMNRVTNNESKVAMQLQMLEKQQQEFLKALQPVTDLDQEVKDRQQSLASLQQQVEAGQAAKTKLDREIAMLNDEKIAEQGILEDLRGQQTSAVRDWLMKKYASQVGPVTTVRVGDQIKVSLNTLFGTLTADYEHEMAPGEERPATVTFTPAVFAKDLSLPGVDLGPELYTPGIPAGMEFVPATVKSGGKDKEFQLKQREAVDPEKAIEWTWKAKADKAFKGAKFKIAMNASERQPPSTELTVAHLPIKIDRKPDPPKPPKKPWIVEYAPYIAPIITGIVMAVIAWFIKDYLDRLRGERDETNHDHNASEPT